MIENSHRALVAIDGTYLIYYAMFSAVKKWEQNCIESKNVLKGANETDQQNLPNILKYPNFCRYFEKSVASRLECAEDIASEALERHPNNSSIKYIMRFISMDSPISDNWRKAIYPEYKLQRKLAPKRFHVGNIMAYGEDLIRKKLEAEKNLNCKLIKVPGAEGDDILATILMSEEFDSSAKILIASDKDFLQIQGIEQYDLAGEKKTILPKESEKYGFEVTPQEYLIIKTIVGDKSDNIPGVFDKVGPVRAIRLVKDHESLKKKLSENVSQAKQFIANKKIIDFRNIPDTLRDEILNEARPSLCNAEKRDAFLFEDDMMRL